MSQTINDVVVGPEWKNLNDETGFAVGSPLILQYTGEDRYLRVYIAEGTEPEKGELKGVFINIDDNVAYVKSGSDLIWVYSLNGIATLHVGER